MIRPLLLLPLLVRVWGLPSSWNGTSITNGNSPAYTNPPEIEITTMTGIANDLAIEKGVVGLELNYKVYEFIIEDHPTTSGELMVLTPKLANTPESEQPVHVAIRLGSRYEPWGVRYVSNSYLNPIIGGQRATSRDDYVHKTSSTQDTTSFTLDPEAAKRNIFSEFYTDKYAFEPQSGQIAVSIKERELQGAIQLWGVKRTEPRDGPFRLRAPYDVKISGKLTISGQAIAKPQSDSDCLPRRSEAMKFTGAQMAYVRA